MSKRKYEETSNSLACKGRARSAHRDVSAQILLECMDESPSLRGIVSGYIAEKMFRDVTLRNISGVEYVYKPNDQDQGQNKSDATFLYHSRWYTVQVKSIITDSIKTLSGEDTIRADVTNDGSDSCWKTCPDGSNFKTSCYLRGEYDILAACLYPITGRWEFAYKLNRDCRSPSSRSTITEDLRQYFLAGSEEITWPLTNEWTLDITELLDDSIGELVH